MLTEPDRSGLSARESHELDHDGRGQLAQRPTRCEQLAELVLGEQGVRLALRVAERAPALRFQAIDPVPEENDLLIRRRRLDVEFRHATARARRSRKQETAPGSRWPTDRAPSRSARPRRATRARVERMPSRAAIPVAATASARPPPSLTARA